MSRSTKKGPFVDTKLMKKVLRAKSGNANVVRAEPEQEAVRLAIGFQF